MTKHQKTPRLISLDVLRGVAIFLVLGCHYARYVDLKAGVFAPVSRWFYNFGWMGVDLFFVLSGFLVGGLLFQELKARGHLDVRRFLMRRALRIWPLYFVYIGLLFMRHAVSHRSLGDAWATWWTNLLHVQNYSFITPRPHTWSLAVEEHFYLALPAVLMLVALYSKRNFKREIALESMPAVPWIAAALSIGCLMLRTRSWMLNPTIDDSGFWLTFQESQMRADSLFFGVLLAYWYHFEPQRLHLAQRYPAAFLLVGLALVAPVCIIPRENGPFVSTLGLTLLYLGFGAVLLALLYTQPGQGTMGCALQTMAARTLAWVGVFSYAIYVWHHDIADLVMQKVGRSGLLINLPLESRWLLFGVLHAALAVAGGVFWFAILEKPTIALRDRFFPSRTGLAIERVGIDEEAPTVGKTQFNEASLSSNLMSRHESEVASA